MRTKRATIVAAVFLMLGLAGSATAGWVTSGNDMYSDVSGNIGIGTTGPAERLEVAGNVKVSGSGNGIVFPDGSKQTTAAGAGLTLPYSEIVSAGCLGFKVTNAYDPEASDPFRPRTLITSLTSGGHFQAEHGIGVIGTGEDCGVLGAYPASAADIHSDIIAGMPIERPPLYGANVGRLGGLDFGVKSTGNLIVEKGDIVFQTGKGVQTGRIWAEPAAGYNWLNLSGGDNVPDLRVYDGSVDITGVVGIYSSTSGNLVIAMGEGLDYAEGFDTSAEKDNVPGTVLVIDPEHPGKLTVSMAAYDTKVAGIVAGAKGLGSGVRLGSSHELDATVALAGRVYCNVDATASAVAPGDLLTTSSTPGYAMKASDYRRAQGAILGKAMERLEKGKKEQILVLVTLQ